MSFHAGQTFTFGETPSATKWNYIWENDYALQDWSAFTNDTFPIALIQDGDLTAAKLDADAIGHGFLEIGRTTLGSNGDLITVNNLPAKKYLRVYILVRNSGTINALMTFNNDSGNNYAWKFSVDFGAATNSTSQASISVRPASEASGSLSVVEIVNVAAEPKYAIVNVAQAGSSGAGNAPRSLQLFGKWQNTSAQITRIDVAQGNTGDFLAGSEVVVFGKD